jgi:uncharacterized membrane protein
MAPVVITKAVSWSYGYVGCVVGLLQGYALVLSEAAHALGLLSLAEELRRLLPARAGGASQVCVFVVCV